MNTVPFLFDTNIFIEPYKKFYGFDICPGYWDALKQGFATGSIISIKKVYDEIMEGEDELVSWTKNILGKAKFIDETADNEVVQKYYDISNWVNNNDQFIDRAKREFLKTEEADPWICAYAAIHPCIVVTHEEFAPNIKKSIKLPNVLQAYDVEYIDLFDCLRRLETQFHLA